MSTGIGTTIFVLLDHLGVLGQESHALLSQVRTTVSLWLWKWATTQERRGTGHEQSGTSTYQWAERRVMNYACVWVWNKLSFYYTNLILFCCSAFQLFWRIPAFKLFLLGQTQYFRSKKYVQKATYSLPTPTVWDSKIIFLQIWTSILGGDGNCILVLLWNDRIHFIHYVRQIQIFILAQNF